MKRLTGQQQETLERLAGLPDKDIDVSDQPEILDWSNAERGKFYRPVKQNVTTPDNAPMPSFGAGESDLNGADSEAWLRENWQ